MESQRHTGLSRFWVREIFTKSAFSSWQNNNLIEDIIRRKAPFVRVHLDLYKKYADEAKNELI